MCRCSSAQWVSWMQTRNPLSRSRRMCWSLALASSVCGSLSQRKFQEATLAWWPLSPARIIAASWWTV
eukprot:4767719-Prorocentrum_lima.AAC.1